MGVFTCKQMTPKDALEYFEATYGFAPRFEQCGRNTPNLFEPNLAHPLWDKGTKLTDDMDRQLGEIARTILAQRTSRHKGTLIPLDHGRNGTNGRHAPLTQSIQDRMPELRQRLLTTIQASETFGDQEAD